jgi:hypothetical protein
MVTITGIAPPDETEFNKWSIENDRRNQPDRAGGGGVGGGGGGDPQQGEDILEKHMHRILEQTITEGYCKQQRTARIDALQAYADAQVGMHAAVHSLKSAKWAHAAAQTTLVRI